MAWLTRSIVPSRAVMMPPIGAASKASRSRRASRRSAFWRSRSRSTCSLRAEMSRMQPMVSMRSPMLTRLVLISIGKHEPSLRRPTASVVAQLARRRRPSLGAMTSLSGCPITSYSL